jgi:pyridoxine kinase
MKNVLSIQSHVVYGHAGNSAAVFPMRRVGVNVWPLNAVQFSNHTQYPQGWTGRVADPSELTDLAGGMDAIGVMPRCDAVLTGYIGSAEQGRAILDIVRLAKERNPEVWFFCDPVMGHPVKGCKVAPGVAEFHRDHSVLAADMMSPNVLELGKLVGREIENVDECLTAARELIAKGPRLVLVKHLSYAARNRDRFEMMLVTMDRAWHTARPLIEFERQPVGVGDVVSGLMLASLLKGVDPAKALEFVTAAVYEVILETLNDDEFELQLVAAQEKIASPAHHFPAAEL